MYRTFCVPATETHDEIEPTSEVSRSCGNGHPKLSFGPKKNAPNGAVADDLQRQRWHAAAIDRDAKRSCDGVAS